MRHLARPHSRPLWLPFLALEVMLGCTADLPLHPQPSASTSRDSMPRATTLGLQILPENPAPLAASVRLGEHAWRLGAQTQWRGSLRSSSSQIVLRVRAIESDPLSRHHALRLHLFPPLAPLIELPLIRVATLSGSLYRERLDLLTELVVPWAGTRIRLWQHRPIRVWLPPPASRELRQPDHRVACLEALHHWNQLVDEPLLRATRDSSTADVICTVHEEARLAYTRALLRDSYGRPLRLRLHVSPRWPEGAEKYLRRAYLHELGHVLGLWGHSRELRHVMSGRALLGDEVHPHERAVLRLLWTLPDGFDLAWVERTGPPTLERSECPLPSLDLENPR